MPETIASAFFLIMASIIAICINAGFLGLTVKWVENRDMEFSQAFEVCLFILFPSVIAVGFVGGTLHWVTGSLESMITSLPFVMTPLNLLISTYVFSWYLNISFGRSLLVLFIMLATQAGCLISIIAPALLIGHFYMRT